MINNNKIKNSFVVKTANDWLVDGKLLSKLKPIFGPLWFEGETCFFFGKTGTGKTIYAMQIAKEIASNYKVLYCDFELSTRQFTSRYNRTNLTNPFPNNLYRLEINPDVSTNENTIIDEIEELIKSDCITVLIIDNISWLLMDGQEAKKAAPFMQKIATLKAKYNLSIMIIAHTPKNKIPLPIESTDMAGSMVLQNFVDSSFAIANSTTDNSIRYIKQTKCRSGEIIYHQDNVFVMELIDHQTNGLFFKFLQFDIEDKHLVKSDKQLINSQINAYRAQGKSYRAIGDLVKCSHTQVRRIIKGFSKN